MAEQRTLTGVDLVQGWLAHRDTFERSRPTWSWPRTTVPATLALSQPRLDLLRAHRLAIEPDRMDHTWSLGPFELQALLTTAERSPDMSRTTPPADRPGTVEFRPPAAARRASGFVLLLCLLATAMTAYVAWDEPTTPHVGIAAVFFVLTAFVWAVRAGATPTRVTMRGGQVEVVRGDQADVFDLTSRYTPVEVVGRPGERGWRVVFLRPGLPPFAIDDSMVDPHAFMAAAEPYLRARPDAPIQ